MVQFHRRNIYRINRQKKNLNLEMTTKIKRKKSPASAELILLNFCML